MDFLPKDKNVQMGLLVVVSLLIILILKNSEKKLGINVSNLLIGIVMLLAILGGVQMNDSELEGFQGEDEDEDEDELQNVLANNVVTEDNNAAVVAAQCCQSRH